MPQAAARGVLAPTDERPPPRRLTASRPEALSLRANFSWTLLGNIAYAGCQWAMLVVLAKLTSPEEVGLFALALAVTGPVFMFSNLQLRALQATDARRSVPFSDYLSLRVTGTGLGLAAALGIAYFGGYSNREALVIGGLAVAKSIESVCDVLYGLFQQHEQMDRIAHSLLARGGLSLALLGIGVWLGRSAAWGILGIIVAWAAVLLAKDWGGRVLDEPRAFDDRANGRRLRDRAAIALRAFPLAVVMLLISLNTNIPRYFVQHGRGARELGIFAALASTLTGGQLVVSALGQSSSPRLAHLAANKDRAGFVILLRKLLAVASLLGGAGVLIALVVGRPLIGLLFTVEYEKHSDALVILMVAAALAFAGSFLGSAMTALSEFNVQVPLLLAACSVTIVWAAFDVPRAGINGAARSLVAAAMVQLVGSVGIIFRRLSKEHWE